MALWPRLAPATIPPGARRTDAASEQYLGMPRCRSLTELTGRPSQTIASRRRADKLVVRDVSATISTTWKPEGVAAFYSPNSHRKLPISRPVET